MTEHFFQYTLLTVLRLSVTNWSNEQNKQPDSQYLTHYMALSLLSLVDVVSTFFIKLGLQQHDSSKSQAGREAAQNDFYESTSSGAGCPGDAGNWCAGYNVGYNSVMNDLRTALR